MLRWRKKNLKREVTAEFKRLVCKCGGAATQIRTAGFVYGNVPEFIYGSQNLFRFHSTKRRSFSVRRKRNKINVRSLSKTCRTRTPPFKYLKFKRRPQTPRTRQTWSPGFWSGPVNQKRKKQKLKERMKHEVWSRLTFPGVSRCSPLFSRLWLNAGSWNSFLLWSWKKNKINLFLPNMNVIPRVDRWRSKTLILLENLIIIIWFSTFSQIYKMAPVCSVTRFFEHLCSDGSGLLFLTGRGAPRARDPVVLSTVPTSTSTTRFVFYGDAASKPSGAALCKCLWIYFLYVCLS